MFKRSGKKQIILHLFVNKRIEVSVVSTVTSSWDHKLDGPRCLFKALWTLLVMDWCQQLWKGEGSSKHTACQDCLHTSSTPTEVQLVPPAICHHQSNSIEWQGPGSVKFWTLPLSRHLDCTGSHYKRWTLLFYQSHKRGKKKTPGLIIGHPTSRNSIRSFHVPAQPFVHGKQLFKKPFNMLQKTYFPPPLSFCFYYNQFPADFSEHAIEQHL